MKAALLLGLLFATWEINAYHLGVFPQPQGISLTAGAPGDKPGQWIPRSGPAGINHLILEGGAYARGLEAGKATRHLLYMQEKELTTQLETFVPSWVRRVLEPIGMRYFWGADRFIEPWMAAEMLGVSRSAPLEFNYLGDPYSRQLYYHGIHEIGQMMVDRGGAADMGCTVVAIPATGRWVVGRNFDFEGGRIFDREKIMKWVFPEQGHAFVSVIWAGMVGAVTGVNDRGLYISLNAAGSGDFRRQGTPSTLVLLKALQFASTADEAVKIITGSTMFITDIFIVTDRNTGQFYRLEKSPERQEALKIGQATVVANHLASGIWANDETNLFRRDGLTSGARVARGQAVVDKLPPDLLPREAEQWAVRVLRDKGEVQGKSLHLGNRRAIDPLIATHSVVYDESENVLLVNEGPGASGRYLGFDLEQSFRQRKPVQTRELPADPLVSQEAFYAHYRAGRELASADRLARKKNCVAAEQAVTRARAIWSRDTSDYYSSLGDVEECKGRKAEARAAWKKALELLPAYREQIDRLKKRLES